MLVTNHLNYILYFASKNLTILYNLLKIRIPQLFTDRIYFLIDRRGKKTYPYNVGWAPPGIQVLSNSEPSEWKFRSLAPLFYSP